jgi:hypothetical protein
MDIASQYPINLEVRGSMMYHGFLLILPLVSFFSSYVPLVRTAIWPSPSSAALARSSASSLVMVTFLEREGREKGKKKV